MIITDNAQIKTYELIESDLKLPADATFTRSSVAYLSNGTQVVANQPRFEQGKFGKAIMLEEGTTNIISASDLANLHGVNSIDGGNSYAIQQPDGYWRVMAKSPTNNLNAEVLMDKSYAVVAGQTWTESFYFKSDGNVTFKITFFTNNGHHYITPTIIDVGNGVKCAYATYTLETGATYIRALDIGSIKWGTSTYIDILFGQLEQKPYATSFIDGTRSAETLAIPTEGILNPQEGTVECWVYIDDRFINGMVGKYAWIWGTKDDPHYPILNLYRNVATNTLRFVSRDANNNQSYIEKPLSQISVGWHYIACTWKSSRLAFLLDGQLVGEVVNPYLPNVVDAQMYIGHNPSAGEQCNTLIDDLRISNKARSDEEILTAYQSRQPLLVDEWTTYKLDFDDKIRITAQGQIICNEFIEI